MAVGIMAIVGLVGLVGWTMSLPLTAQTDAEAVLQPFYESHPEFCENINSDFEESETIARWGHNRGNKLGPTPLWPNGTVVYQFDRGFDEYERRVVLEAIEQFHNHTCVKFVERTNEQAYIKITQNETNCFANVGYQGQKQQLILAKGTCNFTWIAMQELMHSIGFNHEHRRPDRDQNITIHWENMDPSARYSYDISLIGTDTWKCIPYDYHSIMHYGEMSGSINGKPTIVPKIKLDKPLGNNKFSPSDIKKINIMYECIDNHECK